MTNTALIYFTGRCLTLDENPRFSNIILKHLYTGQIDWNRFVWLCSNHLILQVIYLKFKTHNLLSELPDHLTQKLNLVHQVNCIRNTSILEQVADITFILNSENIYPLFMKGTGNLLDGLYRDIGERIIGDIDFLVPEEDYLKAAGIMLAQGYEKPTPDYGMAASAKHFPRLFRKDVPADVEIHRAPVNIIHSRYFNASMIFRDKKCVPAHPGCYIPSDEHKIIQNFIHAQLDHQGYRLADASLRDLYDLYLLSKRKKTISGPIPYKRKALNYAALAERILGQDLFTSSHASIRSALFCFRFDFYHHYPALSKVTLHIPNRIYRRYVRNFALFIFNSRERHRLISRLKEYI